MLTDRQRIDTALVVAGIALWMATHPYAGIYQDANLYLLMALNWLAPEAYASDPWFLFGSQDAFSFFSPIYGMLLRMVGISDGARSMVLLGGTLWLAASWLSAHRILPDALPRAVAFLGCAVYSINISPVGSTFVLNESFATARLVAVPLGIGAVALGAGRRSILPWIMALGAVALHPLFGIWALFFLIAVRLSDRLLVVAVPFAVLIPFLVPTDVAISLLRPLDPERLAFLRDTTKDLLISTDAPLRLNSLLFWLGALMVGGQWGREGFRRAYQVIALLSAAGYLLSVIVSNFRPLAIFVEVQPWRAVWLAAYFSIFAVVDVAWRVGSRYRQGWYWVAMIFLTLVVSKPMAGYLLLGGWAVCRCFVAMDTGFPLRSPSLSVVRFVVVVAAAVALPGYVADVRLEGEGLTHFGWTIEDTLRGIVGGGGFGLGPLLISVAILKLFSNPRLVFSLLFPILVWVGYCWDTRDEVGRRWEESFHAGEPLPFSGFHRGQTVYWPGRQQEVWFGLGTAAYVGEYHLSGLVFSKQRTELVDSRWKRVAVSSLIDRPVKGESDYEHALGNFQKLHPERDFGHDLVGNYVSKELTPAGLVYLCADPRLDWVVAEWPEVEGLAGTIVNNTAGGAARQYAYDCRNFRGGAHAVIS